MAVLSRDERVRAVTTTAPWIFGSASIISTTLTGLGLLKFAELGNGSKVAIGVAAMTLAVSLALAALSTIRDPESQMMEAAVLLFAAALLLAGSIPLAWAFD